MNHSQKRSFRIVYNDYECSFQELLELHNSVLIHHRNICLLAIVWFKVKNGLTIQIMPELFDLWNTFVYMLMNGIKICFYCMFLYNGVNSVLICCFVNPTPIY